MPEVFVTTEIVSPYEVFFGLLRRKNSTTISIDFLTSLIDKYDLPSFYEIIFKIINNNLRSKQPFRIDDKKNIYEITYIGHNFFYLSQDDILALFNKDYNNVENYKILQIMITIYNEYEKNNLSVDKDVFISSLFYQLNNTEDFSSLDFMINNNLIPVNKNLGFYLIDRSKTIADKVKKNLSLNLGVEILLSEKNNIDDVLNELVEEKKYNDAINIITDFYFGYSYNIDKINKNIRDINSHLRKFIKGKLNTINKMGGDDSTILEESFES